MKNISILALEIYQKLGKKHSNLTELREATKKYILSEISQWTVKSTLQGDNYFFKPKEFSGDKKSSPFEIGLFKTGMPGLSDLHELKFGNLDAETDEDRFKWEDSDPYKLQKALFLKTVLETKVKPLIDSGRIEGIVFQPYDGDGLGDQRYSYFYNMYLKLGKDKYDLEKGDEGVYFITPK